MFKIGDKVRFTCKDPKPHADYQAVEGDEGTVIQVCSVLGACWPYEVFFPSFNYASETWEGDLGHPCACDELELVQ